LGALLVESCAMANVLQAIRPPSAKAAIRLSFFIFNYPVFFIGLFVSRRFTRRRTGSSLHKDKTPCKSIGYTEIHPHPLEQEWPSHLPQSLKESKRAANTGVFGIHLGYAHGGSSGTLPLN